MHTDNQSKEIILDFTSFIRQFFDKYIFDEHNTMLIKHIGMWANRDPKFNGLEPGWHIDRSILLVGMPGVGKDVIFRLLRKYLKYLRSSYTFQSRVVWEYAEKFKQDMYGCFDDVMDNCYFQELARTDENKAELTLSRETVQHYGNKVLIGNELINVRYNMFIEYGYQSHFSTNHNEDQLEKLYGVRCSDRLREMCNYMIFKGSSKRGKVEPQFVNNKNKVTPPVPRETTVDEHAENYKMLEAEYITFCETSSVSDMGWISYNLLVSYGVKVLDDEELLFLMESITPLYLEDQSLTRVSVAQRQKNKEEFIWKETRRQALIQFYGKLKDAGCKSIFNEVEISVVEEIKNKLLLKNNL